MTSNEREAGLFDDRRRGIFQALEARSRELASYYKTAIHELQKKPGPGLERVHVSTVCHAVRELINGLPSVMGETSSDPIKPSSRDLLRSLPEFNVDSAGDDAVVPIPRAVAKAVDELVRTASLESKRVRDDLTGLLADTPQKDHPLVTPWNKNRSWFVKWAHWDRPTDESRPVPTKADMLDHLRLVEDVIEARTAAFFDSRRTIDDLLKQANAEESAK